MAGQYDINDMASASREALAAKRVFEAEVAAQTKYHAHMGGGMLGAMQDAPIAELRSAIERANAIHENMMDMCGSLGRHLDRVLGSRPENADASCLNGAVPDSEMGSLRTALSDIDQVARRLRSQVERLESL